MEKNSVKEALSINRNFSIIAIISILIYLLLQIENFQSLYTLNFYSSITFGLSAIYVMIGVLLIIYAKNLTRFLREKLGFIESKLFIEMRPRLIFIGIVYIKISILFLVRGLVFIFDQSKIVKDYKDFIRFDFGILVIILLFIVIFKTIEIKKVRKMLKRQGN